MGQKLYTTAEAAIRENKDGSLAIDSISEEVTADSPNLNQAMIARTVASAMKVENLGDVDDIVGKNDKGEWIRMDEI